MSLGTHNFARRALEREHLYEENGGMIVAAAEKPLGNIGGWSDSD
jgi:hypothetical protein